MPIGLEVHFLYFVYLIILILSLSFVFFVGYNFFLVLIYLELSALAVSSILVITANYFDSFFVEFFAVLLMAVVGAESAVAISILILAANQGLDLNSHSLSSLKGLHFLYIYVYFDYFWPYFYILSFYPLRSTYVWILHVRCCFNFNSFLHFFFT